jgi:ribosomal protein S18 acetylase RimI-like enzyme
VARALPSGRVVGCVAVAQDATPPAVMAVELRRLAVHPAYRRRGLGQKLVQTAVAHVRAAAEARAAGACKVRLTCLSGAAVPAAAAACALYVRLGFVLLREYSNGLGSSSRAENTGAVMCDFELSVELTH